MQVGSPLALAEPTSSARSALAAVVGVALCMLVVLAVFWRTTLSMAEIWRTTTFEHCVLVFPIVLWLVWRERLRLAATPARPYWPALFVIGALGLAWLAAEMAGLSAPSHLAVVAMIPAAVLLVFGTRWVRILWFPLAFLIFAVPIGDSLIPFLIDRTADFTVTALRFSGIPVYREEAHFVIPSGRWSVVEACSGVRFLIASVMAGSLYAWLMYRSTRKRLLFLGASIAMPIVANWLRAYITVLVAHLTSNQWMAGEEHVTFGRILFSALLLLMFWIGARWREDDDVQSVPPSTVLTVGPSLTKLATPFGVLLVALTCWPVAAHMLLASGDTRPVQIVAMEATDGWKTTGEPISDWEPHLVAPLATQQQFFERDGQKVGVWIGVYRNQDERSKLASSYNRVVGATSHDWRVLTTSTVAPEKSGLQSPISAAQLQRRTGLLVWHWYWLGDHVTANPLRARFDLAVARLTRRSDTSAWVAVYTPTDDTPADAQAALSAFMRDNAARLDAALRATAER